MKNVCMGNAVACIDLFYTENLYKLMQSSASGKVRHSRLQLCALFCKKLQNSYYFFMKSI